ncbi:helix-turn-helix domain-containing protein [Candidatus Omnitrophota bacterium]
MPQVPAVIKQLEDFMCKQQFTQTDLANYLGIAVTQVNRWLNSKKMSKAWIELLKAKGIIKQEK